MDIDCEFQLLCVAALDPATQVNLFLKDQDRLLEADPENAFTIAVIFMDWAWELDRRARDVQDLDLRCRLEALARALRAAAEKLSEAGGCTPSP